MMLENVKRCFEFKEGLNLFWWEGMRAELYKDEYEWAELSLPDPVRAGKASFFKGGDFVAEDKDFSRHSRIWIRGLTRFVPKSRHKRKSPTSISSSGECCTAERNPSDDKTENVWSFLRG
jgi:hypothetical protein